MLKVANARPSTFVLALGLSALLAACGGGGTTPTTNAVTAVAVTPKSLSLTVGQTAQLTPNVTVTGTAAKTVSYTSVNGTVASVSTAGLVTGVAAGSTTINVCSNVAGYTNKCDTVAVTVTGAAPTLTTARINFTNTAGTVTVNGVNYTSNTGAAYDAATGIGWVREDSVGGTLVPLDMTPNGRNRTASNATGTTDPRQYTQINMQCNTPTRGNPCAPLADGTSPQLVSGAFVYKVVNGKYNVTVSVGDAAGDPSKLSTNQDNQNSVHVINVNGTNVVPALTPTGTTNATNFSVKTATVTVTTGSLIIDAKNGQNTKLNYVDIVPAP